MVVVLNYLIAKVSQGKQGCIIAEGSKVKEVGEA